MTKDYTKKILQDFGLNTNEIEVYLCCIEEENLSPFRISKLTQIPRSTVYDVLMNLSLKGLVELQQSDGFSKQQTLVSAVNPSQLRAILQEKRKKLIELETEVITILPFLKSKFHRENANADFIFYPGLKGFRKLYLDTATIEIDVERFVWDMNMPMDPIGFKDMNKLMDKEHNLYKKIRYKPKHLVALNDWTRQVVSYQYGRDKDFLGKRDFRYIDNPIFDLHVELNIWGNIIRIFTAHKDEIWGLQINSPALAASLKSIFLVQWANAKPLTENEVLSWGTNYMQEYEKRMLINSKNQ